MKNNKITFLFGAGASIPFYNTPLTTNYITNEFVKENRWEKYIKSLNKVYTKEKMLENNIKEIICIINKIRNLKSNLNFEQIIEVLDKLSSFYSDPINYSDFDLILKFFNIDKHSYSYIEWTHIPYIARLIISDIFLEFHYHKKKCLYLRKIKQQRDFIQKILKNYNLSIYSLNYDDILNESVKDLNIENGFDGISTIMYFF